jgi:hypothetical protein
LYALKSLIALLLVLAVCAGCQALGAVVGKAAGTQPIPARFVPPKVPTLVFAEHRAGANVDDVAAEDIGRRVAEIWQREKISPIIDSGKVDGLRSSAGASFSSLSIDTVGRRLGADQVLYIDVLNDQIESPPASDLIRGKMSVRVRIVDVKTATTLWPRDAVEGYPMEGQSDWTSRGEGVTDSSVEENLRNGLAEDIARLFYKYTPPG